MNGVDKMVINDRFKVPAYVDEGMLVIAPYVHEGKRTGLRCHVAVAAGYSARVVNARYNFDKWFCIDDLRIESDMEAR